MKAFPYITLVVVVLCLLFPVLSFAQTTPPTDPIDTPIDGGVSLLIAAGVGYGVKKYRDQKKKKEQENNM